jgi:hypothetical protein
VFDSKISAEVCLSTKKSETIKETNRTGPRIVRDIIDSTSREEFEDAGLVDMIVHKFNLDQILALVEVSVTNVSYIGMG